MTFTQFKQYMEIDREKQLQAIRQEVGSLVGAIVSRVDANLNDIAEIKEALKCIKTRGISTEGNNNEAKKFDIVRRSLRFWPVLGRTEEEIWNSTGDFVHKTLGIPLNEIDQEKIESVRRMRSGRPGQRIKDEVLVRFSESLGEQLRTKSC